MLAIFIRNGNVHGKGADVLRKFIEKGKEDALTAEEKKRLRRVFTFLDSAYHSSDLVSTRLASDYSHFYIMTTSLLSSSLLPKNADEPARTSLVMKLNKFAKLLDAGAQPDTQDPTQKEMNEYIGLSARQTTDAKKRKTRQSIFEKLVTTF